MAEATTLHSFKTRLHQALKGAHSTLGLWLNGAIAALIVVSSLLFALQTYPLPESISLWLQRADQLILALFTLEYLLRLWASPQPIAFLFSLYGLIDLVAILPFVLGFWSGWWDLRSLRLIRWLRILRLARFFEPTAELGQFIGLRGLILARIVFTLTAIIFIYAGGIYQVEHEVNGEDFGTLLDAIYFAVVTMTTVGFGDLAPVSEAGRGLTILMIFTGIALIPTQVGDFIQQFTKAQNSRRVACSGCGWPIHDTGAQYCDRCGKALPAPDESSAIGPL